MTVYILLMPKPIYLFQKKSELPLIRKNRAVSNPTLCIPAAIEIHEYHCTESVCQLVCTSTVLNVP